MFIVRKLIESLFQSVFYNTFRFDLAYALEFLIFAFYGKFTFQIEIITVFLLHTLAKKSK